MSSDKWFYLTKQSTDTTKVYQRGGWRLDYPREGTCLVTLRDGGGYAGEALVCAPEDSEPKRRMAATAWADIAIAKRVDMHEQLAGMNAAWSEFVEDGHEGSGELRAFEEGWHCSHQYTSGNN